MKKTNMLFQKFIALDVIGVHILLFLLLLGLLVGVWKGYIDFFKRNALLLSFLVALYAVIGSLFFSDIMGYPPCKFCWFQRIFIYPQALILLVALFKKDKSVLLYTFWLSIAGGLIAAYHYAVQNFGISPSIPCSVSGQGPSCDGVFVKEFRYVTIPMMALTVCVCNAVLSALSLGWIKTKNEG